MPGQAQKTPAMKTILLIAALALAGCAATRTSPAAGAVSPPVAPRSAAIVLPTDPVADLSRFAQADSLTPLQASALLGPPDIDRRDGIGALLTWRLQSCALVLGFANDRLVSTDIAARQQGAATPTAAQCITEAQARRGGV